MWKSRVSENRSLSHTVGRRAIQTKGKPKFRIPARGQEASTQYGPSIHTAASQSRPSSRELFPGDLIADTVPFGKVWGAVVWGYYLPLLRVTGDYAGEFHTLWHYLLRESESIKLLEDAYECLTSQINLVCSMFSLRSDKSLNHI